MFQTDTNLEYPTNYLHLEIYDTCEFIFFSREPVP